MSGIDKDPSQIKWAIEDINALRSMPWNGDDAVMEARDIEALRRAGGILVGAFEEEVVVPRQPILDALEASEEDNVGYLARIEQLRREHLDRATGLEEVIQSLREEVSEVKRSKLILGRAIDDAIEELDGVEVYGSRGDAFAYVIDDLKTAQETADYDPAETPDKPASTS